MGVLGFGLRAVGVMCLSISVAAADSATQSDRISVVAIAEDAGAVIVRDAHGDLRRYLTSETVSGTHWRVQRIAGNRVIFRSSRRLHGEPLETSLRSGDSIDFATVEAALSKGVSVDLIPASVNVRARRKHGPSKH